MMTSCLKTVWQAAAVVFCSLFTPPRETTFTPLEVIDRSLPAQNVRRVQIDLPIGNVDLIADTSGRAKVQGYWPAIPGSRLLVASTGDRLTIRGALPLHPVIHTRWSNQPKLVVHFPAGVNLLLHIGTGNASIWGTYENSSFTLERGSLYLARPKMRGVVNVNVFTGPVTADLPSMPVKTFRTTINTGRFNLILPQRGAVSLDLLTRLGRINAPGLSRLCQPGSPQRGFAGVLKGNLGVGGKLLYAHVGTGIISVQQTGR